MQQITFGRLETYWILDLQTQKANKWTTEIRTYDKKYYSQYKSTMHPSHHHLFHTPAKLRIKVSPQENKQWINTVKLAIKIQKKNLKKIYRSHAKIAKYFPTKQKKRTNQTLRTHSSGTIRNTQTQENHPDTN